MQRIYLDHNATAPLLPAARRAWSAAQDEAWGNPAAVHEEGRIARHRLDRDRAAIARMLGCRAYELVCTGSGTEAAALAIRGAWRAGRVRRILVSGVEHSSILRNAADVAHDACEV
ncbi:MAG: aminotransferase class V-fold PLP-dependent enzyme, partial [Planctomycetota bacterium]